MFVNSIGALGTARPTFWLSLPLGNRASRCAPNLGHALFLGLSLYCAQISAAEITVFAASSLTDSLKKIARTYQIKTGDKIIFNFGASSLLARQIEEGAPADIFFSADEAKMDALAAKGLIAKETRRSPLSNVLVIVVPKERASVMNSAQDLTNSTIQRIALGDPKTVPIGLYARQYLEKLGLWEALRRKVVIVEDVRAGLAAVEAGNADAAFVYKTDAAISHGIKVAVEIPRQDGPKISYSIALVKGASHETAARQFLDYIAGKDAAEVFQKFGFIVPPRMPK